MGYFANGTDGSIWEENNCLGCIHDTENGCPVLELHLEWNYEQHGEDALSRTKKLALEMFIPTDGMFAGKCKMRRVDYERYNCKSI